MVSLPRFDHRTTRLRESVRKKRDANWNVQILLAAARHRTTKSDHPTDSLEKSLPWLQARGLFSRIAVGAQKIELPSNKVNP